MEDDCGEDFDFPSLLCEELDDLNTKNSQGIMGKRRRDGEGEVFIQREDEEAGGETGIENKDGEEEKEEKQVGSMIQEVTVVSSEDSSALSEPPIGLRNSCDLDDPVYLGCGGTGLYCPPVPIPLLYSSLPPVPPHSAMLPHSLPQLGPQTFKMEITEIYSAQHSILYSTTGGGHGLRFSHPLPPAPKKKLRIRYSTDQLEQLEAFFLEDPYPDGEKRIIIAAAVGVPPQSITVVQQISLQPAAFTPYFRRKYKFFYMGAPSFSGHFATKLPHLTSTAPSFPTLSNQTVPSHSNLLASLNSPGQSRVRDGGQHQVSSQGGLAEYHPGPMHSPPPLGRASLPLFTTTYNPANPTPPLLNTLAHTRPLFLDAVEAGSSMAHRDSQSLQTDTSLTSTQQNNNLPYQLQASYSTSQPQHQPQASLPRMAYLTPNPPDSNPTSSLTFGPRRNSTGTVTFSTGAHAYFQSQSTGQILLQSAGHRGGITAHQSYPLGNMYSQPAIHQHAHCPSAYPASLGGAQDHQPPSSTILPPPSFFSRGDHSPSHASSTCLSHTHTHNTTTTTTTTTTTSIASVVSPVSTLRPSRLRAKITPTRASSLLPSQVSPASPECPPVPPRVKIEEDSPRYYYLDFSPHRFFT